jgi:hypothetical protein
MRYISLLACCLMACPAFAESWPSMVGTWSGTSRSVVIGSGGHFEGTERPEASFREIDFTIVWMSQDDGRLAGTITSNTHTESIIGVASSDGTALYTVDHDGHSSGHFIDADHFELCYTQTDIEHRQMVASCVTFARQN